MNYCDFERCVLGAWKTDPVDEVCNHIKKEKENDMTNKHPGYCERCRYKNYEVSLLHVVHPCDLCHDSVRVDRSEPTGFVLDIAKISFRKDNDMSESLVIKSCETCMYSGNAAYKWPCSSCSFHSKWIKNQVPQTNKKQNNIPRLRIAAFTPSIKDVIFNPPATIVIWEDKTKTVVKCGEGDIYDPEKGLAMAISRKALGDRGSYYNVFEKWLEPYYKKQFDNFVADACLGKLSKMGCVTVDLACEKPFCEFKQCGNCIYRDRGTDDYPCGTCSLNPDYEDLESNWKPISECDHKETEENDVCDGKIKERCSTCKYSDVNHRDDPCRYCYYQNSMYANGYWEPKASDD